MDIKKLLKGRICECGMEHTCDIKEVIIEKGAIEKLGALLCGYKSIVVVADKNT